MIPDINDPGISALIATVLTLLITKGGPLLMRVLQWRTERDTLRREAQEQGYSREMDRLLADYALVKAENAALVKAERECFAQHKVAQTEIDHLKEKCAAAHERVQELLDDIRALRAIVDDLQAKLAEQQEILMRHLRASGLHPPEDLAHGPEVSPEPPPA